jgi:uncharacterized protein with GYD domain
VIVFYVSMGEYDYISIGESPSNEVGMAFVMQPSSLGNVRTTIIQALTKEEFIDIVKKLP